MATTNPFDITATSTGQTAALDTAAPGGLTPAPNTVTSLTPNNGTTAAQYTPQLSTVDANKETTAGQLQGIIAEDSPLMQQARAQAKQGMAQRGLINSSMSQGAGVAAMLEKATPIATADAAAYGNRALANQNATNTGGQFNASQQNQFGLQTGQQTFAATQAEKDRAQQTALQTGQQTFAASQNTIQNDFNARQAELVRQGQSDLQAKQLATTEALAKLQESGVTNRFDKELALKSSQFSIEQNNIDKRQLIENKAKLDAIGLQIDANRDNIPTAFAANLANTTMAGVDAIIADGSLNAAAKQGAITNLVTYANAQIAWASKFYGTTIPPIAAPTLK
jgi:hypothetical protein